MSDLPASVTAALRSPRLVAGVLVELDMPSGVVRAWSGAWELTTSDGKVWSPVGEYGGVSALEGGSALEAPGFTLELRSPGVGTSLDEAAFVSALKSAANEDVFGGAASVYLQVFDLQTNELVGAPQAIVSGLMVNTEADWQRVETAVVRVQCEHILAWSRMAPAAYLTGPDQQARHPGDRICEFTSIIPTREVTWPRD